MHCTTMTVLYTPSKTFGMASKLRHLQAQASGQIKLADIGHDQEVVVAGIIDIILPSLQDNIVVSLSSCWLQIEK